MIEPPTAPESLPIQVMLSSGAAQDKQLRWRLHDIDESLEIGVSTVLGRADAVNIVLVGEYRHRVPRCIVISTVAVEDNQNQALESGAAALVTPTTTATELGAIIAAVHHGFAVIPSCVAPRIAERLQNPPDMEPITTTQRQLLQLLATGHTLKEASLIAGCSERHARRHLRRLWDTLRTPNQTSGMVQATRYGLIDLPGQTMGS